MGYGYMDLIIKNIKENTPFAFSRWGDGEWLNIRKQAGANCDGNHYYHDLGDSLKRIVCQKQDYFMGAQNTKWGLPSDAREYDQDWLEADMFHIASIEGRLKPLLEALDGTHVVYIGNRDLKSLTFINEFIEIPHNNCWLKRYDIIKQIINHFEGNICKVFCFSAGMAANYFIHALWNINQQNTYLDVGSVFDPYVGKQTRTYHKNIKV